MLNAAIPTPSPINVTVSVPPDTTLDNATLALAVFTAILAVFTIMLAIIGARALRWQRREIEGNEKQFAAQDKATRDQLALATKQFESQVCAYEEAREQARPLLETVVSRIDRVHFSVIVKWVRGTEPAFDPEVWVKQAAGVYSLPLGSLASGATLPPPGQRIGIQIGAIHRVADDEWPFPEAGEDEPLKSDDFWAGLTWRSADQYQGRYLVRCLAVDNPNAPPPVLQHYRPLIPSRIDPPATSMRHQ